MCTEVRRNPFVQLLRICRNKPRTYLRLLFSQVVIEKSSVTLLRLWRNSPTPTSVKIGLFDVDRQVRGGGGEGRGCASCARPSVCVCPQAVAPFVFKALATRCNDSNRGRDVSRPARNCYANGRVACVLQSASAASEVPSCYHESKQFLLRCFISGCVALSCRFRTRHTLTFKLSLLSPSW
jgi:hypothetical protein